MAVFGTNRLAIASEGDNVPVRSNDHVPPSPDPNMIRIRESAASAKELKRLRRAHDIVQELRLQVEARRSRLAEAVGASRKAAELTSAPAQSTLLDVQAKLKAEEKRLAAAMAEALESHVAWEWLSQIRGVEPVIAARLLSHLNVTRAPTPSAFWSYCGLSTTEGDAYACTECGLHRSFPSGTRVSGDHKTLNSTRDCPGSLVRSQKDGVRVAAGQVKGSKAAYNKDAKQICYLLGISFLRAGGTYADYYRSQRGWLEVTRPGWSDGRTHLAALRKAEKLFLSHLWVIWREAEGLPVTQPYQHARDPEANLITPWEMVGSGTAGVA
jgi:hypothetical protein